MQVIYSLPRLAWLDPLGIWFIRFTVWLQCFISAWLAKADDGKLSSIEKMKLKLTGEIGMKMAWKINPPEIALKIGNNAILLLFIVNVFGDCVQLAKAVVA